MFKNLKSLFIEEVEDTKKTKEQKEVKQEVTAKSKVVKTVKQTVSNTSVSGEIDQKIIDKLLLAIEKSDLDGFDYFEFKKALKALDKIPMDEATKYRSTFATASTMGVTLEKLTSAATHYIKVLDNENNTFLKAFEGQLETNIGRKEKDVVKYGAIIKEKSEKIKQLTTEIAKHQQEIERLKSELNEGKRKIDKTKNDFSVSYVKIRTQIKEDVDKMNKYLK